MAPEQVSGTRSNLGPAADVHALVVILYELLTGRPPFQGDTPGDTLDLVAHRARITPPDQPARFAGPRNDHLEVSSEGPSRRYESAQALADDLARFLDRRPIQAHASRAGNVPGGCRPRLVAASLAASIVVCFLGSF